jgi:hypothetical protein
MMKQFRVVEWSGFFLRTPRTVKIFQDMICIVLFCVLSAGASANIVGQSQEPLLPPLPICLVDDPAVPADISRRLVDSLKDDAMFSLVGEVENAAIVIRMTRDEAGEGYVASAEAGAAACLPWEHIKAPIAGDGLEIFIQNLQLVQRMQGLFALSRTADTSVKIRLSFYRSGVKFEKGKPVAEGLVLIEGNLWRLEREEDIEAFTLVADAPGQAVILSATNTGTSGAYVYGVNFTRSGKIIPFTLMPDGGPPEETGFVAPGSTVEFNAGVLVLEEESEGIVVVKSDKPLDLSASAASGFYTAFSSGGIFLRDDGQGTW